MSIKEIPGARPYFGGKDKIATISNDIKKALETGQISLGRFTKEFETKTADLCSSKFALSVSSGGTALEIVFQSLDLNGGEVIVPTDTFVASANAVIKAGGKPVFANIDPDTLCLDPEDVIKRITSKTVGIVYVHMFGLIPQSFNIIKDHFNKNNLFIVEDAAHAHGATLNGIPAGSLGVAGCFSYYATKVLTSGEGGSITTNDQDIYNRLLSLRNHGKSISNNNYNLVSNNYRMPEISCIIASHQLSIIDEIIEARQKIAFKYCNKLKNSNGLSLLKDFIGNPNCSYWRFPVYLDEKINRDELQSSMMENHKIRITWMYEPLCHNQPVFKNYYNKNDDFSISENAMSRLICVPCYPGLTDDEIERVCSALKYELSNQGIEN
tara:strand:+ start:382 stop:1527 length:1146 start_codon:yes stop_codon:yes gene_type:complete